MNAMLFFKGRARKVAARSSVPPLRNFMLFRESPDLSQMFHPSSLCTQSPRRN
jgi:hypothetical protein